MGQSIAWHAWAVFLLVIVIFHVPAMDLHYLLTCVMSRIKEDNFGWVIITTAMKNFRKNLELVLLPPSQKVNLVLCCLTTLVHSWCCPGSTSSCKIILCVMLKSFLVDSLFDWCSCNFYCFERLPLLVKIEHVPLFYIFPYLTYYFTTFLQVIKIEVQWKLNALKMFMYFYNIL